MKIPDPTIISIESHGNKYTAELPWDVGLTSIMTAFKGLLVASNFPQDLVNEAINDDDAFEKSDAKNALIELYEQQITDLTMMSKIELGDDVITEIKRLKSIINE